MTEVQPTKPEKSPDDFRPVSIKLRSVGEGDMAIVAENADGNYRGIKVDPRNLPILKRALAVGRGRCRKRGASFDSQSANSVESPMLQPIEPGHGRSRRLALPSPECSRHGTPPGANGNGWTGGWDALAGAPPHQRRARAAYPFSPVRFRLPGWTIPQSPEVHQTAGASSTAGGADAVVSISFPGHGGDSLGTLGRRG